MGTEVLNVTLDLTAADAESLHVYAHCEGARWVTSFDPFAMCCDSLVATHLSFGPRFGLRVGVVWAQFGVRCAPSSGASRQPPPKIQRI